MNSFVTIKSFQNGIKLYFNEAATFEQIIDEIVVKFSESKKFFNNGKIALSYEGKSLNLDEEKRMIKAIEDSAEMTILYIISKDCVTEETFTKAINLPINIESRDNIDKVYSGNLKKGDKIEAEGTIVILGDVEPGASIVTDGCIIILGGLYGTAICKNDIDYENCLIYANDVSAEKIVIGPYEYLSKEKPKWVVKPKMTSKIAYINNYQVSLEAVSKDVLNKICGILNS